MSFGVMESWPSLKRPLFLKIMRNVQGQRDVQGSTPQAGVLWWVFVHGPANMKNDLPGREFDEVEIADCIRKVEAFIM